MKLDEVDEIVFWEPYCDEIAMKFDEVDEILVWGPCWAKPPGALLLTMGRAKCLCEGAWLGIFRRIHWGPCYV